MGIRLSQVLEMIKMKNYSVILLLLLFCFFQIGFNQKNQSKIFVYNDFAKHQLTDKKLKLDILRNYEDSNIILYLNVNGKVTDSLRIDFVNFVTDSLININDTMWHYMYSVQSIGPDSKYSQQMIFAEKNNKLHVSFGSDYIYYEREHRLNDSFFYGNAVVTQYVSDKRGYTLVGNYDTLKKMHFDDTIPNGEYKVSLKYDALKKVYYQQIEFLTAPFSVSGKYLKTEGRFNNEKVLSIHFLGYKMVFWENHWFQCNTHYYEYGIKYNLIPIEEMYRWRL